MAESDLCLICRSEKSCNDMVHEKVATASNISTDCFQPLIEKRDVVTSCCIDANAVEFYVRFDKDLNSSSHSFREVDFLKSLFGILDDQLFFQQRLGHMHSDGHTGNMLVNICDDDLSVAWSDFGETPSSSNATMQLQRSFNMTYLALVKAAKGKGYTRFETLMRELAGYFGRVTTTDNGLVVKDMYAHTVNFVTDSYESYEVKDVLSRVTQIAIDKLSADVNELTMKTAENAMNLQILKEKMEAHEITYEAHKKQYAADRKQYDAAIEDLRNDIRLLKELIMRRYRPQEL